MQTTRTTLWALMLAATLGGCGGGDSSTATASCVEGKPTMLFPFGCGADGGSTIGAPSVTLGLTDAAGAAVSQVTPTRAGSLQASVKDARGAAAPNVAVTFSTTDATGRFVPTSGTALTDASGIARVGLPAGTQTGAFTVTASAEVNGVAIKGTAGYAVAFPALAMSAIAINPSTLSAGGNASVSLTVSDGATPYAPPLPVTFSSPCIVAGKATLGSPTLTQGGVATASYSDKGCGVADVITASVSLGGSTVTQTGTITVLPAAAGSIKFVSADTTNIALKGTGGFGRQEFSTLKFEVYDKTGNKVSGKLVDFVFSDAIVGSPTVGVTLNPTFATSAADGSVTTLVMAGTIPTSVRVVASIHDTPTITTLSNILVLSTGVPDQKHFSLATGFGNCEGRDLEQACSVVTATLGDHFGNPVPDGTAVNFTSEGGVIDASCVTGSLLTPPPNGLPAGSTPTGQTTNSKIGPGSGTCSVLLRASSPRPPNGRVTVLAYALGEETFNDNNGNNVFDTGDTFADKGLDIFRDDDENGRWNAGEPCVGPNNDKNCTTPGDGKYNGVLRTPRAPSDQTLYVSGQLVQTFSGSHATITFNPPELVCPPGGTVDVQVKVVDQVGNVMPANTNIHFNVLFGYCLTCYVTPSDVKVNNIVLGIGEPMIVPIYPATVKCAPGDTGKLFATVTTPAKVESIASVPIR